MVGLADLLKPNGVVSRFEGEGDRLLLRHLPPYCPRGREGGRIEPGACCIPRRLEHGESRGPERDPNLFAEGFHCPEETSCTLEFPARHGQTSQPFQRNGHTPPVPQLAAHGQMLLKECRRPP